MSIAFQKQNGSFTIITKNKLDNDIKNRIIDTIDKITKLKLFVSYNFSDMIDTKVYHYVLDESKIDLNKKMVNELKKSNQIENLNINY